NRFPLPDITDIPEKSSHNILLHLEEPGCIGSPPLTGPAPPHDCRFHPLFPVSSSSQSAHNRWERYLVHKYPVPRPIGPDSPVSHPAIWELPRARPRVFEASGHKPW